MPETIIDLFPMMSGHLYQLMFEPLDNLTLRTVEHLLKIKHPGNYTILRWANPDETRISECFKVIMKFDSDQERIEWLLKYR